jgi:3-carboxy-cis,cis-muconate cycloisomerase
LTDFEAIERDTSLLDVLIGMPEIMKHATDAELASMCDPANHIGLAGEMADRILDRRRAR